MTYNQLWWLNLHMSHLPELFTGDPEESHCPPGAQTENHGLAPSLQLISNYVSESLGTARGRGGQKVQGQQEQDISSVLPGSSQGFMDNQRTLKEKI